MQRLIDFARGEEVLVVHDFAYADLAFDGYRPPSILAAEGATEVAVELYSLTKSFSMAGWRVGFALGNAEALAALARLKSYLDYGTFQPIQIASIVALREAGAYSEELCDVYRSRRDALCGGLSASGLAGDASAGNDVRVGAAACGPGRYHVAGRRVTARAGCRCRRQPRRRLRAWR